MSMSRKLFKYLNGSLILILLNQSSTSLLRTDHSSSRRPSTSSSASSHFRESHKEHFAKDTCYNKTTCGTSLWRTMTLNWEKDKTRQNKSSYLPSMTNKMKSAEKNTKRILHKTVVTVCHLQAISCWVCKLLWYKA